MNAIECALAKQRLQLAAQGQRSDLVRHAQGLGPLFEAADRIHEGACWVRRHPEVVAAGVALLLTSRPDARRFAWRWGRRAFMAWRLWRDSRRWLVQEGSSPVPG